MRSPLGLISATPVVKNLIIINAIMFIFSILQPHLAAWLSLYMPGAMHFEDGYPHFEPFQLVTHMFMHADIGHIFFNMFALWMVGPAIERYWGPKKFLSFYFICGLAAAGAQILWDTYLYNQYLSAALMQDTVAIKEVGKAISGMLGASGAISGILMAFAVMFPNERFYIMFFPVAVKAKYLVVIYLAIDILGGFAENDNIAHFAHAGGAIIGFLMCFYWKYRGGLYSDRLV